MIKYVGEHIKIEVKSKGKDMKTLETPKFLEGKILSYDEKK
jgi:hypothetical protein